MLYNLCIKLNKSKTNFSIIFVMKRDDVPDEENASKKVRFEEAEISDDEELEQQLKRNKPIKTDGYDSDSDSESNEEKQMDEEDHYSGEEDFQDINYLTKGNIPLIPFNLKEEKEDGYL